MTEARWEAAIADLAEWAARETGIRPDAIPREALRRTAETLCRPDESPDALVRRARQRDPQLTPALRRVALVGETYFFRNPEQFAFLATHLMGGALAGQGDFCAWSAGCATGEEAYSLAAMLLALLPPGSPRRIAVMGTDISETAIETARVARYQKWSVRESVPILYPTFETSEGGRYRVSAGVRGVSRFEVQNLLDPPPAGSGPFDLILCRNVLVYFSPEAAQQACMQLQQALKPGGLVLFGTLDLVHAPGGLTTAGPPELAVYVRPRPGAVVGEDTQSPSRTRKRPRRSGASLPVPPPPGNTQPEVDPVAQHLQALVFIERGEWRSAATVLRKVTRAAPDYLPAILERALLHARVGESELAVEMMREVMRRTDNLPLDQEVRGPENLPVTYYRTSAQAFLGAAGRKEP